MTLARIQSVGGICTGGERERSVRVRIEKEGKERKDEREKTREEWRIRRENVCGGIRGGRMREKQE